MTIYDATTRKAAVSLVHEGKATMAEVAGLVGTSRQLVRMWCDYDGAEINRNEYLRQEWQKALKRAEKSS